MHGKKHWNLLQNSEGKTPPTPYEFYFILHTMDIWSERRKKREAELLFVQLHGRETLIQEAQASDLSVI